MDFDIIEGLSDEEVQSLWNDSIVDGETDGVHTGACACRTSSGAVYFGTSSYGYCTLLQRHARDQAGCTSWCRRHGFTLLGFGTLCYCLCYGQSGGTYGYIDRCGG